MYINVSGANISFLTILLHEDRDADYGGDGTGSVKVFDAGTASYDANDVVWTLAVGN